MQGRREKKNLRLPRKVRAPRGLAFVQGPPPKHSNQKVLGAEGESHRAAMVRPSLVALRLLLLAQHQEFLEEF